MKRLRVMICCLFALAGCIVQAKDTCIQRPGEHFGAGVARELSKGGIAFRIAAQTGVCVAEEFSAQLDAAVRHIDGYFWEVAYKLRDACEERAFAEWATKESLRFDIGDVVDLGRGPAGRMFHLRSYTSEEVASNRRKLDEAPKGETCSAGNVVA